MLDFSLCQFYATNNLSDLLKYFSWWKQLDGLRDKTFSLKINAYTDYLFD